MQLKELLTERHNGFSTEVILKQPKNKRNIFLLANKYINILKDIKKEYYTEDSFEYWWNKTAISDKEKDAVLYLLRDEGIIQPNDKQDIKESKFDELLTGLDENQKNKVRTVFNYIISKLRTNYKNMSSSESEALNKVLIEFLEGRMW